MSVPDLTDRVHALCALARQDWDAFRRVAWAAVGADVLGKGAHIGVPPGYYRGVHDMVAAVPDLSRASLYCRCSPGCHGVVTGRWRHEGLFWAAVADPVTILRGAGFEFGGDRAAWGTAATWALWVESEPKRILVSTWLHLSPHLPLAVAAALDTVPSFAARLAEAREAMWQKRGWKAVAERAGRLV